MTVLFKIFLIFHIISGSVGLLTGLLNLIRKKGDVTHKLNGKIFYASMLTAGISSLLLACLHPNFFLFAVGVFTLYMVISGQRYIKLNKQNNFTSGKTDWTITFLMSLAGLLFISVEVITIFKSNLFGLVYLTFGVLGMFFVWQDFQNYKARAATSNYWLTGHLQRMTGGFIAALTAFLVVNKNYFPDQIPAYAIWILPTILLTPLIIKWSRSYGI